MFEFEDESAQLTRRNEYMQLSFVNRWKSTLVYRGKIYALGNSESKGEIELSIQVFNGEKWNKF